MEFGFIEVLNSFFNYFLFELVNKEFNMSLITLLIFFELFEFIII